MLAHVVDCQWTDWGNWTQCSVTCNGGTRTRSRQYLVTAQYGGKGCAGEGIQTNTCNTQPCPGEHLMCMQNDNNLRRKCPISCTPCDNIASALYNFLIASRTVDCTWLDWSHWSACNQTCGGGQRYRIRVSSPALYGGKNCSGASEEKETCNSQPCSGNICVSDFKKLATMFVLCSGWILGAVDAVVCLQFYMWQWCPNENKSVRSPIVRRTGMCGRQPADHYL